MSGNILEVTFRLRDSVNAHSHVANLSFKIFKLGDQFIYVNQSLKMQDSFHRILIKTK